MQNRSFYIKRITLLAVLTALAAVCSIPFPSGLTFRIGEYIKISPIFVILAITANIYGWKGAALVAVLSDLIQGYLFTGISPLILLANLLTGITFGLLLYNSKRLLNIIITVLITQCIISMGGITLVLIFKYGLPPLPTIYFRLIQTAILIIIEIPAISLINNTLSVPDKLKKIGKI